MPRKLLVRVIADTREIHGVKTPPVLPGKILVGAILTYKLPKVGHSMAGVICDGIYKIFDSRIGEIDLDWSQPINEVLAQVNTIIMGIEFLYIEYLYVPMDSYEAAMSLKSSSYKCGGRPAAWSPSKSPKAIRIETADTFGIPVLHMDTPITEPNIVWIQ